MEKLIELLNEYDGKNHWWDYDEGDLDINEEGNSVLEIKSKEFGFIQWLVDNDKIDTRKIDEDRLETIQYSEKERVTICDWLLMLLAIQDEPIDFLISILK